VAHPADEENARVRDLGNRIAAERLGREEVGIDAERHDFDPFAMPFEEPRLAHERSGDENPRGGAQDALRER
jgi:hypothetical protein